MHPSTLARWVPATSLGSAVVLTAGVASTTPRVSVHVEAAAAHPVDDAGRFSWGGAGVVAPELAFADVFGVELAVGAVALSGETGGYAEPGLKPSSAGVAGFSTVGPRVRPLAPLARGGAFDADGLWIAGGIGAGLTGDLVRPVIRAAIGFEAGSDAFTAGPFVGYFHLVEPDGGSLRPRDAKIGVLGVTGSILPITRRATQRPPHEHENRDDISAARDACPDAPSDLRRYTDEEGCPEGDVDPDGAFRVAEPPASAAEVLVVGDQLLLEETIRFRFHSAEIAPASFTILEKVADFLLVHPEYARVRIAGHADDTGEGPFNLRLSVVRAASVRSKLVEAGVDPERLEITAFGDRRPRARGTTEGARAENRRVEFHILERRP